MRTETFVDTGMHEAGRIVYDATSILTKPTSKLSDNLFETKEGLMRCLVEMFGLRASKIRRPLQRRLR